MPTPYDYYAQMSKLLRTEEARGDIRVLLEAADIIDELHYLLRKTEIERDKHMENTWISVKDKLPDKETEVLVRFKTEDGDDMCLGFYEDGTVPYEYSRYYFGDEEDNMYLTFVYGKSVTYGEIIIDSGWYEPRVFPDIRDQPPVRIDYEVTHWMKLPECN